MASKTLHIREDALELAILRQSQEDARRLLHALRSTKRLRIVKPGKDAPPISLVALEILEARE